MSTAVVSSSWSISTAIIPMRTIRNQPMRKVAGCSVFKRELGISNRKHGLLQPIEEARRLETVHLGVVELERDGQGRFEEPPAVFAPGQEGIGEQ